MNKKETVRITVNVDIETDCDNRDDIEAALCSALADLSIDYDCEDEDDNRTVVEGRIAIAATERCRVDSGVTEGFKHPGVGVNRHMIEGRTFVCG